MILVTGANGRLGTETIKNLVKLVPAHQVVAAVRDTAKAAHLSQLGATVRQLDYNNEDSVVQALKGVEKLLLISGNEADRVAQHKRVIDAAKKAGVKFIAYTSVLKADTSTIVVGEDHRATEKLIRESGLAYSFLRNGWYLENQIQRVQDAITRGGFVGSGGTGKLSAAAIADYAEAAAKVLSAQSPKKIYELSGDDSFTLDQLASAISEASGKKVGYSNLPDAEFRKILEGAGLPAFVVHLLGSADEGLAKGDLQGVGHDLRDLIGRSTGSVAEQLRVAGVKV